VPGFAKLFKLDWLLLSFGKPRQATMPDTLKEYYDKLVEDLRGPMLRLSKKKLRRKP